jgi:hypothetical protein
MCDFRLMDLNDAFDRVEDFCAVQHAQPADISTDAARCLQEAVGLTDDDRRLILERLPDVGDAYPGAVLLGLVLGLLATQS